MLALPTIMNVILILRLWTGCMEAAKAIRFTSVAGIRNGVVIEAPIRIGKIKDDSKREGKTYSSIITTYHVM
jgi:hypothetical protein